jgi:norsolorinic acid ketoreductase
MPQTWLVAGASRGFGRALTERLVARGDTVFAAARNPQDLQDSGAVALKWDASSTTAAKELVEQIRQHTDRIDAVVANAGIAGEQGRVEDLKVDDFMAGFQINTLAPVLLFQAVLPLLRDGSKFIYLSSGAATQGLMDKIPFPMGSVRSRLHALTRLTKRQYGASKSAGNFFIQKIHHEHPNLVVFPVHPGT